MRAEFFTRIIVERACGPLDILDVGAGDGFVARRVARTVPSGSSITCVDANYTQQDLEDTSDGIARLREPPVRTFDAVILLDVIEHVDDDVVFLTGIRRDQLRPDGWALISVPAHPYLYTQHDAMLGHHRRYTPRAFRRTLRASGLRIARVGSLFGTLIAPRALQKAGELIRGVSSEPSTTQPTTAATDITSWSRGRGVTSAVTAALRADAWLCNVGAKLSLPLPGLSLWALCERE